MPDDNGAESVFSETIPELMTTHLRHLEEGSGISVDLVRERGYRSLLGKSDLEKLGFTRAQRRTPGILIPLWGVEGKEAGYQYRPDGPRLDTRLKASQLCLKEQAAVGTAIGQERQNNGHK